MDCLTGQCLYLYCTMLAYKERIWQHLGDSVICRMAFWHQPLHCFASIYIIQNDSMGKLAFMILEIAFEYIAHKN